MIKEGRRRRLQPVILAVLLVFGGCFLTRRGLVEREVRVPGATASVSVLRDGAGIPHIQAQNRYDLARAVGYVQAQDRLFQIEMGMALAEGRLAEVVGPELVQSDIVYRMFDAESFARRTLDAYPPEVRAEVEAFASGINSWIEELGDRPPMSFWLLGIKPRPVSAVDVIAGVLPVSLLLSTNLNDEVLYLNLARRLSPDLIGQLMPVALGLPLEPPPAATTEFIRAAQSAALAPLTLPGALRTGIAASNNWAVDGTKSVSGKPMLASDPHLPQSLPSIWYEAVLSTPESFTAGAMIVGSHTPAIGTNGHVAWGVTNVQADVMDLCLEELSADGTRYRFRERWFPVETRPVTIRVNGAADQTVLIRSTQHGPLINESLTALGAGLSPVALRGRYALALRFAAPPGAMAWAGIEATRAQSGAELVEAYSHFTGAVLNLVWADDTGNIGWHVVGAVPDRAGFTGKYPMPCADGEFEWHGMIPYDRLPHVENPPEHFIVTANDRVVDVPYNGDWMPPWRRDRIAELLTRSERLSTDDFKRIQNDRVSLFARLVRDLLLDAGDGGDSDIAWALGELRPWDGAMVGESRAAALCAAVQVTLPARVLRPLLGEDYPSLLAVADNEAYNASEDIVARPDSPLWSSDREERVKLIRIALKDALALLTQRLGSNRTRWSWEQLHTITFKNELSEGTGFLSRIIGWYVNRGPYPAAGGRHTINNGWFDLHTPFATTQISSYRFVVDLAHPDRAEAMNHTGESDIPASPHYDDMIGPWLRGDYHTLAAPTSSTDSLAKKIHHPDGPPTNVEINSPPMLVITHGRPVKHQQHRPQQVAVRTNYPGQADGEPSTWPFPLLLRDPSRNSQAINGFTSADIPTEDRWASASSMEVEPITQDERHPIAPTPTPAATTTRPTRCTDQLPTQEEARSACDSCAKGAEVDERTLLADCLSCSNFYKCHALDYDVREAAKLFSNLNAILAGFAVTIIVLLFQLDVTEKTQKYKDQAIGSFFVAIFGCALSGFILAVVAGDEQLTPKTLSTSVFSAATAGLGIQYLLFGLTLLTHLERERNSGGKSVTERTAPFIPTLATLVFLMFAVLVPPFVFLPTLDREFMFVTHTYPDNTYYFLLFVLSNSPLGICGIISMYGRGIGRDCSKCVVRYFKYVAILSIFTVLAGLWCALSWPSNDYAGSHAPFIDKQLSALAACGLAAVPSLIAGLLLMMLPGSSESKGGQFIQRYFSRNTIESRKGGSIASRIARIIYGMAA